MIIDYASPADLQKLGLLSKISRLAVEADDWRTQVLPTLRKWLLPLQNETKNYELGLERARQALLSVRPIIHQARASLQLNTV